MPEFEFNAEEEAKQDDSHLVPEGWYPAQIVHSDLQETRAGTGRYVKLIYELAGSHSGTHITSYLNVENRSAQAQSIGREQFANVCAACGKTAVRSTEELHDIGLDIYVHVEAATTEWGARNSVRQVRRLAASAQSGTANVASPRPSGPPDQGPPPSTEPPPFNDGWPE